MHAADLPLQVWMGRVACSLDEWLDNKLHWPRVSLYRLSRRCLVLLLLRCHLLDRVQRW